LTNCFVSFLCRNLTPRVLGLLFPEAKVGAFRERKNESL
jgi:hypothetical protein